MIASPEQRWRGRDPRTQTARRWPSAPGTARATIQAVRRELSAGGPLLYRYPPGQDGLPGTEGAFLPGSFWLAQALASTGRVDEATQLFADRPSPTPH
jgi:GH15 family glucan-1,4-alpha-glucosidase